jgi:hypothetical protein
MPTSPLNRIFGTRVPAAIRGDIKLVNATSVDKLKKFLVDVEKVAFSDTPIPASAVQGHVINGAKKVGLSEGEALSIFRLYGTLVQLLVATPSEERFREHIGLLEIEPARAEVLAASLFPHRQHVEAELRPSLSERFGPIVSRLYWRVDKPVAGTEPFVDDPVGVVAIVLETASDSYDERFEVDLASLDLIIEELGNLRRELAKASVK